MVHNTNPRRILHVVSAMNRGGAETLLMNIYRHVDRSAIQFDFVSHRSEPGDFDDEIISLGGRIFKMDSLGKLGPFQYVKQLSKICAEMGPYAAVHAHTDFQSGFVALSAKQAGIKKRICHSHNNDWAKDPGLKSKISLTLLKKIIRTFGTDYCACSEDAARFLFSRDVLNTGRVSVLRNGIDLSPYQALSTQDQLSIKREFDIPVEAKVIGHIGRFYEQKNHRFLLGVLKAIADRGEHFTAILVGDGPLRQEMDNEARRLNMSDHIRFAGVRTDIPRLMRSFDVFAFPSLFEGFGIVMIEAQAAGTPCVAANTVPKQTDMGLGLASYLSLDERPERWAAEIGKAMKIKRPEPLTALHHISARGFDITTNTSDWMSLYEG